MYSAPDSLVRDQGMVESGVTEGGNKTASFHFRGWTQQHQYGIKVLLQ